MTPRVVISVGSRFHGFDLARELLRQDLLEKLYTGYPALAGPRFGVPIGVIRSVWSQEPLNRICGALRRAGLVEHPDVMLARRFDRAIAKRLRQRGNIFVGWSGQCLESLRRARELGMITFVERGSAHIRWQDRILREEYERTGIPEELPAQESIEREMREYEEADFISVPSRFAAETFRLFGVNPSKLVTNPYGVDLSRFSPPSEVQRASGRRSLLRVIHVGRISVQKGVHYLLQAIEKTPGAELILVGQAERGIEPLLRHPRTRYVGPVPGPDLPKYYATADVFCLLSLQEGLGMVVPQAMAMGLPVITTGNVGASELITDGEEGFVVPIRDPGAVAARLQLLAEDSERRLEMGRRARRRVSVDCSWTDYGLRAGGNYRRALELKAA